jgi:hypothetical protein
MPQYLAIAEKQLADAYLELRLLPEALALYDAALPRFEALEMLPERPGRWPASPHAGPAGAGPTLRPQPAAAAELFAAQDNAVGAAAVALARSELRPRGRPGEALALADAGRRRLCRRRGRPKGSCVPNWLARRPGWPGRPGATPALCACLDRARELRILPPQVRALTGQGLVASERPARRAAQEALKRQPRSSKTSAARSAVTNSATPS